MKRLLCILLAIIAILSLCACQGNFESVSLKDPVQIPEGGVIAENTVAQIKNENAIAVFVGISGDLKYEWTVFGSDIVAPKEINLGLQLNKSEDGNIRVVLNQAEAFGFSVSLAVYLNEQWNTQTATAYAGEKAFAMVSVTGSKNTILNLNLDGTVGDFVIRPDPLFDDQTSTQSTTPSEGENIPDSTTENTSLEEETIPYDKPEEEHSPGTEPTEQEESTVPGPTEPEETTEPTKPKEPTQPSTAPSTPLESGEKDKYLTDPVPEGKPKPVEPENQDVNKGAAYSCTFSIECSTILNNLSQLEPEKLEMVPSGGVILEKTAVTFYEGESVFDVLQRVCKENGIHLESSWTPIYNSAYIEGIHNLYEFDCGTLSGWMYKVNGWYPNYGCSRYQLKNGDMVEWRFTCDLGNDIGGSNAIGG